MLRLSPSRPVLWRTETSLQLGIDDAVLIDDVAPWQERLFDALRRGIPDAMLVPLALTLGARASDADRFVEQIAAALVSAPAGALAVRAELPAGISFSEADALARGWRAAGLEPAVTRWADDEPDPGIPVIVVADGAIDPRRAARLMAGDTVHLPIVLEGDHAQVGPIVVPGLTPCLSCLHAHRAAADPSWPVLAAQLIARDRTESDLGLVLEAAVLSGRLLRAGTGATPAIDAAPAVSVRLSGVDARRTWRTHRPHAACLCRSPGGIATADADATRRSPIRSAPPTTPTAFARPA
ncbi:hypothetical protein JOE64_001736 [Microbacterium dextranolyticum]|nr:hypothetical protein [Microbacterium dextranolyticum]